MGWKDYRFTADPAKKGLHQVLGELESEIMEFLWRQGEASVREVHDCLSSSRSIAYTTVMTVMTRLADKKLLIRSSAGKAFIYSPVCSREEFTGSYVKSVLGGLLRDFGAPTVSEFLDSASSDPDTMQELERLVRKREEARSGRDDEGGADESPGRRKD